MKFKAYHMVTENNLESVINETDRPWDWFPELEKFCTSNFFVDTLVFDLDLSKQKGLRETVQRISFKIKKIKDLANGSFGNPGFGAIKKESNDTK